MRVFAKRADEIDGELRIVADPPLIVPIDDLADPGTTSELRSRNGCARSSGYRRSLADHHHPIEEFEYVHTRAQGRRRRQRRHPRLDPPASWAATTQDPLFLQSKEAQPSVLERFVGKSEHADHGRRVVVGQRLMQAASDIFLGWLRVKGLDGRRRDYYVRQLHDWKGGVEVETLLVPGATLYARLCGATLARAHARWGDRIAIASYLGQGRRVRPGDR